jgi:hypothetical protein
VATYDGDDLAELPLLEGVVVSLDALDSNRDRESANRGLKVVLPAQTRLLERMFYETVVD